MKNPNKKLVSRRKSNDDKKILGKRDDEKLFPWLMESRGDLTLEETIDIENLLEDDD